MGLPPHKDLTVSAQVVDLGNDDSAAATEAAASFRITHAGSFKVCYKLAGGNYTRIGNQLLSVYTDTAKASEFRESIQNVSLSLLSDCHGWSGD